MPRPDPGTKLNPHLARWRGLGLLIDWSEDFDGHWRRWNLCWWDGRRTVWAEREVRAAIIAVDELERKIAAHA